MASGVSYLPIKTRVNGSISYQIFVQKLKEQLKLRAIQLKLIFLTDTLDNLLGVIGY